MRIEVHILTVYFYHTEVMESPRYGTLRRQKPNAPSPPTTNGGGTLNHSHSHTHTRPHAKELFPQEDKHDKPQQEKPAKPPQPNLAQLQTSVNQTSVTQPSCTQLEPLPPPPVTPAKPVPMTRTQFFGLDNLPSPTADRRSIDSIGSFRLKPDVPQKPQLPKRPMGLAIGTGSGPKGDSKSDDETITPTQAKIDNGNDSVRYTTQKFIEKIRQDNCDTNGTREDAVATTVAAAPTTATGTTTTAAAGNAAKENNHNHEPQPLATEAANNTQNHTPTSPISPTSFHTPKRPTVPAPPPPTIRKVAD